MSGIELNKIAAAILLASLIAMVVGFVANILYKPKLELSQRGYHLEIEESKSVAGGVQEAPIDVKALMAKANAEAGGIVIKRCVSCHSFDNGGANKVGPNLWKVPGGPKAHRKDFAVKYLETGSCTLSSFLSCNFNIEAAVMDLVIEAIGIC